MLRGDFRFCCGLRFFRFVCRFGVVMQGNFSEKSTQFMAGLIESASWGKRLACRTEIFLFDVVDNVAGHGMKLGMQTAGCCVVLR